MLKNNTLKLLFVLLLCNAFSYADPVIYINQVAFDSNAPKTALIGDDLKYTKSMAFTLVDAVTKKTVFTGKLGRSEQINEWVPG